MSATTEHGERVYLNPGEGVIISSERIAALESERKHFATKADIGDVKTEIADLRTEMAKMESRLTWRMILIGSIFQAIGIGAIKYLP